MVKRSLTFPLTLEPPIRHCTLCCFASAFLPVLQHLQWPLTQPSAPVEQDTICPLHVELLKAWIVCTSEYNVHPGLKSPSSARSSQKVCHTIKTRVTRALQVTACNLEQAQSMHSHCSVVAALIAHENSLLPSSLVMWHLGHSFTDQCHCYCIMSPDRFRYALLHSVHGAVCRVPGMSARAVFPTFTAAAGMLAAGKPGLACG